MELLRRGTRRVHDVEPSPRRGRDQDPHKPLLGDPKRDSVLAIAVHRDELCHGDELETLAQKLVDR